MDYIIHLINIIEIYLIVIYGLNIILGYGGLLSLCHSVLFGIGAYSYAIIITNYHFPFSITFLLSILITIILSFLLSIPALKFRGDSFVIVTLGIQIIFYTIIYNWISLTKGPFGITNIPKPSFLNITINSLSQSLLFLSFWLFIIIVLLVILNKSPFVLSLKTLREDEIAAESIGKSPKLKFRIAFILSSIFASLGGVLYASYISYIDPESFNLNESIFMLSIILIGGSGNLIGPTIGTILLILLPEGLRLIGLPDIYAGNLRQIIYGIILILLTFFRPQGIFGNYKIK